MSSTTHTARGMTCGRCAGSVITEITTIPGVTGVHVDVAAGRLTVEADRPVPSDAVEEAGDEVVPPRPGRSRRPTPPAPHPAASTRSAGRTGSRKAAQMNTPAKLGAYTLGLVAVFGAAAGLGAAVGPVGPAPASHDAASHDAAPHDAAIHDDPDTELPMNTSTQQTSASAHLPGGLQVSENGYTLDVARQLPAGAATPVSFRILGPDGQPVTAYDTAHDEDLHLIAVRRDLSGYQHVHPGLAADGTWSIPLDLTSGTWRLFADFDPAGDDDALVLGADVAVAGTHTPQPLPEPSTTAEVDGYTVTLDGELVPGGESQLTLSVSRDGQPVTDLQPYLAAYGHLVALRDGDLAYLHVHPAGEPGDGTTAPGPDITFSATAPSAGDYRLFLDFQHGDVVRTAEFTVRAGDTAAAPPSGAPAPAGTDEHGDAGHAHG